MKKLKKYSIAVIIYTFMVLVVDFGLGIGIKNQWDKLMNWLKNK